MITYKNVPYRFHSSLWGDFCKVCVDKHGIEDVAEMIDVHPVTVRGWINQYFRDEFPFPSMNKFLNLCNLMDVDPGQFFTIEEV